MEACVEDSLTCKHTIVQSVTKPCAKPDSPTFAMLFNSVCQLST